MLLGPPTQAHLFAWEETTGPPRLSTPATLHAPHKAGPGAGASSQGHLNVWGMGWAWMCIWHPQHPPTPPPSPHPRPPQPPASGQQQLAFLLPSLSWVS